MFSHCDKFIHGVGDNKIDLIKKQSNKSTPWITHPNSPTILCYIPVKLAQPPPNLNMQSRGMTKVKTFLIKIVSVNF